MKLNEKKLHIVALWASVFGIFAFLFNFGFSQNILIQQIIYGFYFIVIAFGLAASTLRYFERLQLFKRKVAVFDFISVGYTLYIFLMYLFTAEVFKTDLILENPIWVVVAVILSFVREFSEIKLNLTRTY